jgi:uncharacterized circularly permuted ATP-grasp superfamily protein
MQAQTMTQGAAPATGMGSAGHFDEMRGRTPPQGTPPIGNAIPLIAGTAQLTGAWGQFFSEIEADGGGTLAHRADSLARQIHDNGVSYNVYADDGGPQRPWSLGLFPLIVSPQDWQHIAAGVTQRVRLLDRLMADVYGPQDLLAQGLLPPALVQGHPDYLRAMHGVKPVGGTHLHIAAFDLARGPGGNWWVAWVICWRTAWRSRACSPRPLKTCRFSAWAAPTVR